ncbi:hypothetical protein Hanom_Chr15g01386391 [Helianthus anomalus]
MAKSSQPKYRDQNCNKWANFGAANKPRCRIREQQRFGSEFKWVTAVFTSQKLQ